MNNSKISSQAWYIIGIMAVAAIVVIIGRLFPHPYNFTPIGALALFVGAYIKDKRLAVAVPLSMLFMTDFMMQVGYWMGTQAYPGFYSTMPVVYACFAVMVGLGYWYSKNKSWANLGIAAIGGGVIFFLVTNFFIWLGGGFYAKSVAGLIECYTMALPFFRNTLIGNIFFSGVFFGVYEWAKMRSLVLEKTV